MSRSGESIRQTWGSVSARQTDAQNTGSAQHCLHVDTCTAHTSTLSCCPAARRALQMASPEAPAPSSTRKQEGRPVSAADLGT